MPGGEPPSTDWIPGFHSPVLAYRGRNSQVFKAVSARTGAPVAVKVMHAPGAYDEIQLLRDLAGARGLVPLLDVARAATGEPALVMPFQPDGSYADVIARGGPVGLAEAVRAGRAVAGALAAAHARGLLHNDVVPGNVLRAGTSAVLTDFGSAAAAGSPPPRLRTSSELAFHAPPEILRARTPVPASDVYALASTLWTLIAGHAPFSDGSGDRADAQASARRALREPVPPLPEALAPAQVSGLLAAAMAKDPEDRPVTPAAFETELERIWSEAGAAFRSDTPAAGTRPAAPPPARPAPPPGPGGTEPRPAPPSGPGATEPRPAQQASAAPVAPASPNRPSRPPARPGAAPTAPRAPHPAPAARPAEEGPTGPAAAPGRTAAVPSGPQVPPVPQERPGPGAGAAPQPLWGAPGGHPSAAPSPQVPPGPEDRGPGPAPERSAGGADCPPAAPAPPEEPEPPVRQVGRRPQAKPTPLPSEGGEERAAPSPELPEIRTEAWALLEGWSGGPDSPPLPGAAWSGPEPVDGGPDHSDLEGPARPPRWRRHLHIAAAAGSVLAVSALLGVGGAVRPAEVRTAAAEEPAAEEKGKDAAADEGKGAGEASGSEGKATAPRPPGRVWLEDGLTGVQVKWEDASGGTARYFVVGGVSGQPQTTLARTGPGVEEAQVPTGSETAEYCFTVVAVDGLSAPSAPACTDRAGARAQAQAEAEKEREEQEAAEKEKEEEKKKEEEKAAEEKESSSGASSSAEG
ncbi:protein kinase [Nocardiopsis sp. CNT-189]|uniref:serine/threonine protein kinase n=1 Tax=Nocardiopsis oceanisediminis TaxID=2816862 RepID=UPI003B353B4D